MINIDTRFLDDVNGDQLWLLCHIIKRADARMSAYPSNKTLCDDTGWEIKKLQKVKASLIERGILIAKPRFTNERRQTSSVYSIRTDFMGLYVPAKNIEVGLQGGIKKDTTLDSTHQKGTAGDGLKEDNKVLSSNEVLFPDSKESGKSDNTKPSDTKPTKPARACYAQMVEFWLKEFHVGWVFRAIHGKAVKSLITKIEATLKAGVNLNYNHDEVILNFFKIMCQSLPEWYKDKDLPTIDSKYNEIIHQIQAGPKKDIWNSKPSASNVFGKYAQ